MVQRLPVTVLSGFLDAGKTTVFDAMLNDREGRRIALIRSVWAAGWGDRRQEIIFIGTDLDERAIRAELDDCLVGAADSTAFNPARHRSAPDPCPAWEAADAG